MSTFNVTFQIGNPNLPDMLDITVMVHTGSAYTFIPREILEALGLTWQEQREFLLADNSTVEYGFGIALIQLNGKRYPVPVVFAPEGVDPLLGFTALEIFGLGIDPVNERLVPTPRMLKLDGCSMP